MKWLITGDTHRDFSRFYDYPVEDETNIIVLGDAGLNYTLDWADHRLKNKLDHTGFTFYLVRGNHEERPENIMNMDIIYDENVQGDVYAEKIYPNIRYLMDGGEYTIDGYSVLVVGGAYSVDKYFRLAYDRRWFPEEQLTPEEMELISEKVEGKHYDAVLTHTCPLSFQPVDLFLGGIDQSQVDNSMEQWMEKLKDQITWDTWFFGHYHADRYEYSNVLQMFMSIKDFSDTIEQMKEAKKQSENQ